MAAKTFEDLEVWRKAHQWVLGIYAITKSFPRDERFGLTSQLRRASISVPANIAEGFIKRSGSDRARFLQYCPRIIGRMPLLFDTNK